MKKIFEFIKKEAVLSVAAILAIVSACFIMPDAAYIGYCNFEVLGILYSLMLVVAGFRYCGVFDILTKTLAAKIKSEKTMIFALTSACFFSSAMITNDVALITFVPFTLAILQNQKSKSIIFAVTMETIAANLGSLVTPIGNPQNLFLYSYYSMTLSEFFRITLPLGGICLITVCLAVLLYRNAPLNIENHTRSVSIKKNPLIIFVLLFAMCILSVSGLVPWYISLAICVISTFFICKNLFAHADYILLLTFVCFFVFVGNISRIEYVKNIMTDLLSGRELTVSAIASQIISNVPAAAMLAPFTDNASGLILGTNIGGLGTLIASMASLISYRQICKCQKVKASSYLGYFTVINVILLILLLVIYNL